MIRGRSSIAAFVACAILLFLAVPAHPSYDTEAGRMYTVASERLAQLRKSRTKKKYRSYWIDCIRTFELVEKKYPKSPRAADACFDRAGVYEELYQYNRAVREIDHALKGYRTFQSSYPRHPKAPEALFRIVDLSLDVKKDKAAAADALATLSKAYPKSPWTDKAKALLAPVHRTPQARETVIRKKPAAVTSTSAEAQREGVVQNIRYWSGGAYTRIVIDQNNPVKFQAIELKHPDRLVFDILNAKLDSSVDKDPLPVNDGILRQVRASQYAQDTVRVVLDLASMKNYVAFPLHDPERLVIDVTGEGEAGAEAEQEKTVPSTPGAAHYAGERLSLSRQLGLKIKTIAIDAGHGGHDPGAIGKGGLKEKDVTLDIARRLAVLVKERLDCKVIMTRDSDVYIPLEERPFIAKSKRADLFVSVHVNASPRRAVRGIETYIQSLRASDREAMATAARENAMSTKKLSQLKSELDRIFADLTRDDKLEESLQLAHAVQGSLVDTMKPVKGRVVNLGVKRAFFYVLINTEMPSILAEVGFISNPEEEKLLRTGSYRQAVAEALFEGIKKYVESRAPMTAGI